jgi:glycosyltransferase involved in cell wall biosynthesis
MPAPEMRTLLFLDYWSLNEPLTQATVLPTLQMVLAERLADRIILVTVERGAHAVEEGGDLAPGIHHVPLTASRWPLRPAARGWDLVRMVPRVAHIVRREKAGFIMARGVVAGGYAHFVSRITHVPYAVDYFEPHNRYMTDVGEWREGGPLDRGLAWLIRQQVRTARRIVTVSSNHRAMLLAQGAGPGRVLTAPCPVDPARMRFDAEDRKRVRERLGWGDARIGIYVGKFGGLYHREHAFRAFAEAQRIIGDRFAMIILSPDPGSEVRAGLKAAGFSGDRFFIHHAAHKDVAEHLSAADMAFGIYRGTPSSACISPLKVGEYWANGLPVLLTRGVGDDSAIIEGDPYGGAVFNPEGDDLPTALASVLEVIARPGQREATATMAARYRSMELTRDVYRETLGDAFPSA